MVCFLYWILLNGRLIRTKNVHSEINKYEQKKRYNRLKKNYNQEVVTLKLDKKKYLKRLKDKKRKGELINPYESNRSIRKTYRVEKREAKGDFKNELKN